MSTTEARPEGTDQRIVVGVDGSDQSLEALEWAAREARFRGMTLEILTTWTYPYGYLMVPVAPEPPTRDALIEEAKSVLDRMLDKVSIDLSDVKVARHIAEGSAAGCLIDASKGAELLVVGKRGLGGFRGLLLGSVSQQCALHAHCPVVVVPSSEAAN
jgi:nucleotide-binding universal stress UspA family protein